MTDAGGNDLLKVDHKGRIRVVTVFPPRLVDAPPGIPDLPPQLPMQAVPTSVVKGPGGAWYVGQLTGFPFPVGAANVWRVVPGHKPKVFAAGFTNIIGSTPTAAAPPWPARACTPPAGSCSGTAPPPTTASSRTPGRP